MKFLCVLGDITATYCNSKIYNRFFIGFSCGIPFLLTLTILDLWLKDCGVSNTVIGLFTLLHWPFLLKFLWAPFIDRCNFPYLSRKLGRRRGWAIASQLLLFAGILGMACSDPNTSRFQLILYASIVAFADGCQDMSLYAYQLDKAKNDTFGPIAGVVVFGYKIGLFFTKSTTLYLAHYFSWNVAYTVMAFSVFLCTFLILRIKEPQVTTTENEKRIKHMLETYERNENSSISVIRLIRRMIFECLVCPFIIFMKRTDYKILIALIVLFRAGDIMVQKMAKPFYIDMGFSVLEIANVVQVFGTIAAIFGGIFGGYIVKKSGIRLAMLYGAIAHSCSCLAYITISIVGHDIHLLYFTVFIENITGGIMGTSFIAFLYSLCDKKYCATQYALLWAFYDFGGAVCRISSGFIADSLGWTNFFIFSALMFLPSIMILYVHRNIIITKHIQP